MGTDSDKCVNVVHGVTERVKLSTVQHAVHKSLLKQLKSEIPLHADGHVAAAAISDTYNTVTVTSSLDVDGLTDGKRRMVGKHGRKEKIATISARLFDSSLVDTHSAAQITLPSPKVRQYLTLALKKVQSHRILSLVIRSTYRKTTKNKSLV